MSPQNRFIVQAIDQLNCNTYILPVQLKQKALFLFDGTITTALLDTRLFALILVLVHSTI